MGALCVRLVNFLGMKAALPETKYIWMNGKLLPWKKATCHVLTHGLHYGSSVFEGIRAYETDEGDAAVFRLGDHMKRLHYSASALGMRIPFSVSQLSKATTELIRKNKLTNCYIRPLAFFGYGKMGLNPKGAPVECVIAAWPWGSYLGEKPITVHVSTIRRIHPATTVCDAKISGHYVNSILANADAACHGCDEALLLDANGLLAEGPGENIFFVKKGVLHTPKDGAILKSITRETVILLAKKRGIKTLRGRYKLSQLTAADEAFFVGTAAEVTAISHVGKKRIGAANTKPITTMLQKDYADCVRGRLPSFSKAFLTVI